MRSSPDVLFAEPFVRDKTTGARLQSCMSKILVIGAGPTGSHTAALLASQGHDVTVVTRRGGSSNIPRVAHAAADARDASALRRVAEGAEAIINCSMPAYDRWPEEFPQIGAAVLSAAESAGTKLVTLSNVYGYGRVSGPIAESHPLAPHTVKGRVRAGMWDLVLRSKARATEVRASDYLGHGAVTYFNLFILPGLLKGEESAFPADLDAPHSWTFTKDVATTLVAAASSDKSWGRAWHVPSHVASVRALAEMSARLARLAQPRLRSLTEVQVRQLAAGNSMMQEVAEMRYLFDSACVLDSKETEGALGVSASPLDEALVDNLRT